MSVPTLAKYQSNKSVEAIFFIPPTCGQRTMMVIL